MLSAIETLARDGVAIAKTIGRCELPVLDVTHPRFALPEDAQSLDALREAVLRSERRHRYIPKFLIRFLLKAASKKSLLAKAMFGNDSGFLDGTSTYVMKLGAQNLLPPYDTPTDRNFASAPHVTFMRLRMQQVAGILADGIKHELTGTDCRALHLINIAGGPAMDSVNALILVARASPEILQLPIVIHVLDLDETGAFFGRNALAALKTEGMPLHGLDIELRHVAYDWNNPIPLRQLLDALLSPNALVLASSEGGLFEYGSDAAILSNLKLLHADQNGVRCVVGSVTRADETRRKLIGASQFEIIPRGLEGFQPLAMAAGFKIGQTRPGMLSDQIELLPV